MWKMDEITGDAETRQGDTFEFSVTGIDDGWTVYFSVYRRDDRNIVFELQQNPINNVTRFQIENIYSDKLVVPIGEEFEIYYYGIKRCKEVDGFMIEDTVIVGNKKVDELNKIKVYPLITNGVKNGTSESN